MKSGFAIIELLIATAISVMLGAALFYSFNIINKYVVVVDEYTDKNLKIATMHQQLEKDLLGTFVPVAAMKPIEEKQPETTPSKSDKSLPPQKKEVEAKKSQAKPISKIFYGVNKENNIDVLSFITGNSLQAYWSKQTGKSKPRIVRVVYRLEQDKESKNSFNLLRAEGNDLKFESYKKDDSKTIKEFTMIEGIKSLQVQYVKEKKDEKNVSAKDAKDDKKKKEFTTLKEWKVDTASDDKAKKEVQDKQLIPNAVLIKGELWSSDKKRAHSFEFKFELNPNAKSLEEAKQINTPQTQPINARVMLETQYPRAAEIIYGQKNKQPQSPLNFGQADSSTGSLVQMKQETVVVQPHVETSYITNQHAQDYLAQGATLPL